MSSTPDEITIEYEEAGQTSSRNWRRSSSPRGHGRQSFSAIRNSTRKPGEYGPDKYAIRRYQKSGGEYRQKSKFNISSAEQARKIVDALSGWLADA